MIQLEPLDFLLWALIGSVGGLLGGLVIRGGSVRRGDVLLGLVGALLGGLLGEVLGIRGEMREILGSLILAFFGALVLTVTAASPAVASRLNRAAG